GITRLSKGLQQRRHELRQNLARTLRAHGGMPAEMPAADRFRGKRRALEAELRKGFERFRVIADAGEDEIADRSGETRRRFEEPRIMFGDAAEMKGKDRGEGSKIRIAAKLREIAQLASLLRQALRLFIGNHLQAMLDLPQEEICGAQILTRCLRDEPL